MSPKRKPRIKDKNYSDGECRELYKILKKYVHIIECKTNAETKNDEKNVTWNIICREFNSITSQVRAISLKIHNTSTSTFNFKIMNCCCCCFIVHRIVQRKVFDENGRMTNHMLDCICNLKTSTWQLIQVVQNLLTQLLIY